MWFIGFYSFWFVLLTIATANYNKNIKNLNCLQTMFYYETPSIRAEFCIFAINHFYLCLA